jgi:hypothetical protein
MSTITDALLSRSEAWRDFKHTTIHTCSNVVFPSMELVAAVEAELKGLSAAEAAEDQASRSAEPISASGRE